MQLNENIVINSIVGDLRQGGWLASGVVHGDTDALSFGENVQLVGKSNADFDDLEWRELFNGHCLATPDYSFGVFASQMPFRLGTANYLMAGLSVQDIGFTEQASPANPHQIATTMRLSDCFEHIVEDHCNFIYHATNTPEGIILETDIDSADTALTRFNFRKSNNLWQALVTKLGGGEEGGVQFYRPHFTRKNVLVYQPAPHFLASPPSAKGALTKEHIRGTIKVNVRNAKPEEWTGQVQIVAVATANTVYTAKYPTSQPADGKIVVKDSGVWADTQARADTLAQNLYEWLTRPYTLTVEVDPGLVLFGDDGEGLDLGDKIDVTYDGPTEDSSTGAGVHLDLSSQAFWLYKASISYDARTRQGKAVLELEADN